MLNLEDKVVKVISEGIHFVFNQNKDKLPYDRTFEVKVVEVLNTNKYKVRLNGQDYSCPSLIGLTHKVNDRVLMLVPCNKWEHAVLIGKVGE